MDKRLEWDIKNFEVRFCDLPKSQHIMLRDIRASHIGRFLQLEGIVIQPTLAVEDNAININGQFGPQPSAKKKKRR